MIRSVEPGLTDLFMITTLQSRGDAPFCTHLTAIRAEQDKNEINVIVTVRERNGEKELEKEGELGVGVRVLG